MVNFVRALSAGLEAYLIEHTLSTAEFIQDIWYGVGGWHLQQLTQ